MSNQLINTYYNALHKFRLYGGSSNETTLEHAFISLVNSYAEKNHLLLVPKISVEGKKGNKIIPDGVLKNALRLEFGYWESKDTSDDLDKEIYKKLYEDGYPDRNILFEDTKTAVLIQEGAEVMRVSMEDAARLDEILLHFINFEPLQVREFIKALEQFKKDVPDIVKNLRELIEKQAETNKGFMERRNYFHELAKSEINPEITLEDIREMLIQHILTEDIFNNVFGDVAFHRYNNIARELEGVLDTFMDYGVRQNHLQSIRSYYDAIRTASSQLADHHEKQKFLKNIYENFYKVYNPKGADRLGVVYTPNEIVRFMIESTDWLLEKHFGKSLGSPEVEILDPATGTGTFIAELIEYINPHDLPYKYLNEIHANEVAILPYYIANLNIEYTYQQKMGKYEMFKNICFVDTLDNLEGLRHEGQHSFAFGLSSENAQRIQNQNKKKISVIIGNPPYNANQANFNDFNKNRVYDHIDKRIKETFVQRSTAQKTKVYDMYARFYRWAIDRAEENGIIAFVTNRSFIDSRTFDGFRACIEEEFDFAYIIDTHSDVRANPKIAGTSHNVFGIQTGVAVMFLVRKEKTDKTKERNCKIYYTELDDFWRKQEKLNWLRDNPVSKIAFETISPDEKHNWINHAEFSFEEFISLFAVNGEGIFDLYGNTTKSNRDEWVYDFDKSLLELKAAYFSNIYNNQLKSNKIDLLDLDNQIKWSRDIRNKLLGKYPISYSTDKIIESGWRPFVKKYFYSEKIMNDVLTINHYRAFGTDLRQENIAINFSDVNTTKPFSLLATTQITDYHFISDTKFITLYQFDSDNQKHENITDWALDKFQTQYIFDLGNEITKEHIFHYVYAVLHAPDYRKKYEQNLKREFPRIPFYEDFFAWRDWGARLMDLHINYETQTPYALTRDDIVMSFKKKKAQPDFFDALDESEKDVFTVKPRVKLRAAKLDGIIEIDSQTTLFDVPALAWEYKLGNRSAIEWILDQYKERKPKDATVAERFNTYKFEDYKEKVIDLIMRVCTVSVETMNIINQMPHA